MNRSFHISSRPAISWQKYDLIIDIYFYSVWRFLKCGLILADQLGFPLSLSQLHILAMRYIACFSADFVSKVRLFLNLMGLGSIVREEPLLNYKLKQIRQPKGHYWGSKSFLWLISHWVQVHNSICYPTHRPVSRTKSCKLILLVH